MGSLGKHKRGGGLAISAQNLLQLPPTLHEAAGIPWSLYQCAGLLQMPWNLLRSGGAVVVRPSAGGHVQHISPRLQPVQSITPSTAPRVLEHESTQHQDTQTNGRHHRVSLSPLRLASLDPLAASCHPGFRSRTLSLT